MAARSIVACTLAVVLLLQLTSGWKVCKVFNNVKLAKPVGHPGCQFIAKVYESYCAGMCYSAAGFMPDQAADLGIARDQILEACDVCRANETRQTSAEIMCGGQKSTYHFTEILSCECKPRDKCREC